MLNFKVALSSQVTLTEMNGKLVLFSKQAGDFYGLNESALVLLKTLLASDFLQTAQWASTEFSVDEEVIREDLLTLVLELEKIKALRRIPVE